MGIITYCLFFIYIKQGQKEIISNSEKLNLNLNENLLFKDLEIFLVENKILQNSKQLIL